MALTMRHGQISGVLYVAYREATNDGTLWIGHDEAEAAAYMATHPEQQVFGVAAGRSNVFEVELVPAVAATVRPVARDLPAEG